MKKEGKIFKSLNAIIVIFAFFYFYYFASSLNAAVPQILSFQGRLTDASGNLIGGNGANRYFKFEIHSTATGDNELWNSGVTAITIKVTQGVFNTLLGDTSAGYSALDLDFDSRRIYLEVQVSDTINSGFETLVPRQRIVASGFAINAETVHGGRFINATGVGQFGGLATVAYSRFGTDTTTHAGTIDASNDLLISGGLEVNGSVAFDGFVLFGANASSSATLEATTLKTSTLDSDGALTIQSADSNDITLNSDSGLIILSGDNLRVGGNNIQDSSGNTRITFQTGGTLFTGTASVSSNFEVGGTASISGSTTFRGVTYTWPAADGAVDNYVLTTNGAGVLTWEQDDTAAGGVNSNSIDFDELVNSMRLDASGETGTTIGFGNVDYTFNLDGTGDFVLQDNSSPFLTLTDTGTFVFAGTGSNTATGEWNFDSNTLVIDSGTNRVGVGTDDLTVAFEVAGAASISGAVTLKGAITGATGYNGLVITPDTGEITTGTWSATDIALGAGGTGATLTDPNADRLFIWDESAGAGATVLAGLGGFLTFTSTPTLTVASYSLDFGQIDDTMTLDANTSIASAGFTFTITAATTTIGGATFTSDTNRLGVNAGGAVNTRFEVGGTASISGTTTLNGVTYTWPSADGASDNFVLTTDSAGLLTWETDDSGTPASQSLDFDEFVDLMTTDQDTTITASSSLTFNLTTTDDIVFQDNSSPFLTLTDTGTFVFAGTGSNTATGEWNFDSNTLVIDSGTNRVGVGTDDLTVAFEVAGAASISGAVTLKGAITGATGYNGLVITPDTGEITTGTWSATDIALGAGGTGATLTDPNADRLFIWDESAGAGATVLAGLGGFLTFTSTPTLTVASDSLDFGQIDDTMTLDANTSIASAGFTFTITDATTTIGGATFTSDTNRLCVNAGGAVNTRFEVGGTASISGTTTLNGVTYTWPSADGASD